jgi:hypothetical protein
MVDIEKHAQKVAADPAPVVKLAERMVALEMRISQAYAQAAQDSAELLRIRRDEMPDLMRTLGIKDQTLTNGWQLELQPVFEASLPSYSAMEKADGEEAMLLEQRRNAGFKWLRGNKAADLIKNILKMDLGKGEDAKAKQLVALAKKLKVPFEHSESVHAGSLKKFLREKVAGGADVPFDTFAVFSGEMASVKPPKIKSVKGVV